MSRTAGDGGRARRGQAGPRLGTGLVALGLAASSVAVGVAAGQRFERAQRTAEPKVHRVAGRLLNMWAEPYPDPVRAAAEIGWLKPGETKTVSWKVKGAGQATVTIASTRGGVDTRAVQLR